MKKTTFILMFLLPVLCFSQYNGSRTIVVDGSNKQTIPSKSKEGNFLIHEGFDDITTLEAEDWSMQNLSNPLGTSSWFQGNVAVFTAYEGESDDSYIGVNYNSAAESGTISNWLITPEVLLENGSIFSFYTRRTTSIWDDRLQVRLSINGSSTDVGDDALSVGDFTELLLDINPEYSGDYPTTWTKYSITLSDMEGPVTGRFAFRYFVENGGPSGDNSDYIGIDLVQYEEIAGDISAELDIYEATVFVHEFPKDIDITITWNNASEITEIIGKEGTADEFPTVEGDHWSIDGNILTLHVDDHGKAGEEVVDEIPLTIKFDAGEDAIFDLTIKLQTYEVAFEVVGEFGDLEAFVDGVEINDAEEVPSHSEVDFFASPEEGYKVKEWTLNGNIVAGNASSNFTIESLEEDVEVTVEFEILDDSGNTCYDPIIVNVPADLNFSDIGQTTCGRGNNYQDAQSAYNDGEDIFYRLDVTEDTWVKITMDPDASWTGLFLYSDCPDDLDPGDWLEVVANSSSDPRIIEVQLLAENSPYFIMCDSWPAPDCYEFDLHIDVLYQVNFSVFGENGTITAEVEGETIADGAFVAEGLDVVFTASPNVDYMVKEWTLNGDIVDGFTGRIYTYEDLDTDIEATVEFEEAPDDSWMVEFSVIGEGTITAEVAGQAISYGAYIEEGSDINFTAEPDYGYQLQKWIVNGDDEMDNGDLYTELEYTYEDLDQNIVVVAVFEVATYEVIFEVVGNNGNLTAEVDGVPIVSGGYVEHGERIDFTAEPDPGYRVKEWVLNGEVLDITSLYLTVMHLSYDHEITVEFEEIPTHEVTFEVTGGNGGLTATVDGVAIDSGDMIYESEDIVFSAQPNPDYTVKEWKVNDEPVATLEDVYTHYNLLENIYVTVEFEEIPEDSHRVTFNVAGGNGSITASVGGDAIISGGYIAEGADIDFLAEPGFGYEISEWQVNSVVLEDGGENYIEPEYTFEDLLVDIIVTVKFEPIPGYIVEFEVEDGENGKLTATADGVEIESGTNVPAGMEIVFTAIPDDGYRVLEWNVNVEAVEDHTGSTYTYEELDKDIYVTVKFEKVPTYTVSFSVLGANGSVSATVGGSSIASGASVIQGKSIEFTASPHEGYKVKEWRVDGVARTETGNNLTYSNIEKNITVNVEFESEVTVPVVLLKDVKVYPNPFRNTIHVTNIAIVERVIVSNIAGVIVIDVELPGDGTIDTGSLPAGIYFITLESSGGERVVSKMVKN